MINVLVTAIGGGGHGDQILKALALAPRGRYEVFGSDVRADVAQRSQVKVFKTLPPANSRNYVDELLSLCRSLDIRAVFHGSEAELLVHSRDRDLIMAEGILVPTNRSELVTLCMDKGALQSRLAALGFESPRTIRIDANTDVAAIDFFPVIAKPSSASGGSANVYIAQDAGELTSLLAYLRLRDPDIEFLVQEYIGTPDSEFTIGILHDLDGTFVDSIAVRRDLTETLSVRERVANRTNRSDLGPQLIVSSGVSQGIIGKFPEITSQARLIAEALGSRGPLNIQCRVVDGSLKVFEINPRLSGTTSLRALVGFNEPDILLRRHLLAESVDVDVDWPYVRFRRTLAESRLD